MKKIKKKLIGFLLAAVAITAFGVSQVSFAADGSPINPDSANHLADGSPINPDSVGSTVADGSPILPDSVTTQTA
jgi:hypothetical protein